MIKSKNVATRFNEILQQIEEDDRNKMDIELGLNELRMLPTGNIVRKGRDTLNGLELSDYAMTQAFNRIGIPVRYGKRLFAERPDLVADQFNHWVSQEQRRVLIRFRNNGNTGIIRGFLSDSYTKLDNRDVMNALHEVVKEIPNAEVEGFYLDDRRTHIRLTLPELSVDFGEAVGETVDGMRDILRVGVDIINSEIGASSLVVSPLVFRLVCLNGLRAWREEGDVFRQRHIHLSSQELFGRMSEAVGSAIKAGDELIERMYEAKKFKVESPLEVIEKLSKKQMYSQQLIETAKTNFMIEPSNDLYGVMNAFTRTARDLKNEQRLEVEKFAGSLLTDSTMRDFA